MRIFNRRRQMFSSPNIRWLISSHPVKVILWKSINSLFMLHFLDFILFSLPLFFFLSLLFSVFLFVLFSLRPNSCSNSRQGGVRVHQRQEITKTQPLNKHKTVQNQPSSPPSSPSPIPNYSKRGTLTGSLTIWIWTERAAMPRPPPPVVRSKLKTKWAGLKPEHTRGTVRSISRVCCAARTRTSPCFSPDGARTFPNSAESRPRARINCRLRWINWQHLLLPRRRVQPKGNRRVSPKANMSTRTQPKYLPDVLPPLYSRVSVRRLTAGSGNRPDHAGRERMGISYSGTDLMYGRWDGVK